MCFRRSSPVGKMMEHSEQISAGSFNFLVLLLGISGSIEAADFLFRVVADVDDAVDVGRLVTVAIAVGAVAAIGATVFKTKDCGCCG